MTPLETTVTVIVVICVVGVICGIVAWFVDGLFHDDSSCFKDM